MRTRLRREIAVPPPPYHSLARGLTRARERSACPYSEYGCAVLADRVGMVQHERVCDFIPRSLLRQQRDTAIRDLESALKKSEIRHAEASRSLRLQMQRLLMSSLGPAPDTDSLKAMFGFTSVIGIPREAIRNRSHVCMDPSWVHRNTAGAMTKCNNDRCRCGAWAFSWR